MQKAPGKHKMVETAPVAKEVEQEQKDAAEQREIRQAIARRYGLMPRKQVSRLATPEEIAARDEAWEEM